MQTLDYHSLFYYGALAPLRDLRRGDGHKIGADNDSDNSELHLILAYGPKESEAQHNYQREKYLITRPELIVIQLPRVTDQYAEYVVLISKPPKSDQVTIYTKALDYAFGDQAPEARQSLVEMMSKFYQVTLQERSAYTEVDMSSTRYASTQNVNDLS